MAPKFLKDIHWPITFLTILLAAVGIFSVYSATFRGTTDYAQKQFIWSLIGLGIFFLTIRLGYRFFLNISYTFYIITIVLLLWVLFFTDARLGANRWIFIGPFALQPSEFAKMATILMLANFLAGRNPGSKHLQHLVLAVLFVGVPAFLILKQPDLGSCLVFSPILLAILFFWGIKFRYLIGCVILGSASLPFLWQALKPYQQKRLLVFLNPSIDPIGASYTAIQSKIAVGSGGLFGKGWLQGTQTQLDFVPEHHTDFIFTVIAEEFGFIGALFIIILFALLIAYGFQILKHTTDHRAKLLAIGVLGFFSFQVVINIAMTIGLAPITGITLPFLSYGGSSLLATFFAFGLLASIYRERSIF